MKAGAEEFARQDEEDQQLWDELTKLFAKAIPEDVGKEEPGEGSSPGGRRGR